MLVNSANLRLPIKPTTQDIFKAVGLMLKTAFTAGNIKVKTATKDPKGQIVGDFVQISGIRSIPFKYAIDPKTLKISYTPQQSIKRDALFLNTYWTKRIQVRRKDSNLKIKLPEALKLQTRQDISYQTQANKAGKVLNCKPGKTYPCGKRCNNLNTACKGQPMPQAYAPLAKQVVAAVASTASANTPPISTTTPPTGTGAAVVTAQKRSPRQKSASSSTPSNTSSSPTTVPTGTGAAVVATKKKKSTTPPNVPASASVIKINAKELNAKRNELIQRVGQKTVEDAEKNVQKILSDKDTNVYIRVGSSDTLEKILGSSFKTSAELGIDTHTIPHLKGGYQAARNRVEAKTLGYAIKGTNPGDRPIYGYIGGKDLSGASHADVAQAYGSIAVKLKSDVKDRSTFTGSDSFKSGIASEVNNAGTPPPPNAASLASMTRHGYDLDKLPAHYPVYMRGTTGQKAQLDDAAKAKNIDDLAPKLAPTGNSYVEAQIHGGVKPQDIAELHFSPKGASDRPNAAIATWAKTNGVKIYTNGKEEDLDKLITPPKNKKTKAQEVNDAIEKGDFHSVMDYAADVDKRAKTRTKYGDHHLSELYADAGYDAKPKVVSEQDITNEWKNNGGTLMIRGVDPGPKGRTQYLDEFKSGDYFAGFGIYGNGTYVSHAGQPPKDADAEDAWNAVGKRNTYINQNGVTLRMALPKDVNVTTQSAIGKEAKKVQKDMDNWAAKERAKIKAASTIPAQQLSSTDQTKVKAAETTIRANLTANYKPKPNVTFDDTIPNLPGEFTFGHKVIIPSINKKTHKSIDPGVILHERSLFLTGPNKFVIALPDGTIVSEHKSRKDAAQAAIDHYITEKSHQDAGVKRLSANAALTPAVQKQLADFDTKFNQMKDVLFGDIGGNNSSGRFAVIRGYDAIKLDKSYEPDRFMNLLNRSKVLIQTNELDYTTGAKKVAG